MPVSERIAANIAKLPELLPSSKLRTVYSKLAAAERRDGSLVPPCHSDLLSSNAKSTCDEKKVPGIPKVSTFQISERTRWSLRCLS